MKTLVVGDLAPLFTLNNQQNELVSLKIVSHRGVYLSIFTLRLQRLDALFRLVD